MSRNFFIFGYGYTAKALAPKLIEQGFKITGTSRKVNEQQPDSTDIQLIDFECSSMEHSISLATHLLISIPPSNALCDMVLMKYSELLKQQVPNIQWLGYLSSTGVYGDHDGNWVNEKSECKPHTPTGIKRLQAENSWLKFATEHQLPLHIFRLSGIYGPGRNILARLMHGKKHSIFKENQVFCRIHVDDIVSALLASMTLPNPLSIYNISDDEPAPTHVVDQYGTSLLHREPLPLLTFSEAHLSEMEHEFYTNNRRVCNLKMKQELKVDLQYPTYREGLTQIWKHDFMHK